MLYFSDSDEGKEENEGNPEKETEQNARAKSRWLSSARTEVGQQILKKL